MSTQPTDQDSFLAQMGEKLAGWPEPVRRLRQALAQDELVLLCQPILALSNPLMFTMAEVLVRLREEEAAMLPPGDFLPVFEHYGMMPELDRWVVGHVVTQLGLKTGFARFSVNLSGPSVSDPDFAGFIAAQLRDAALPPDALVFEIDESDVLNMSAAAEGIARALKEIGCQVLIDGFGQRAVSFAPLKALRLDYVKVDGRIVRNILRSSGALNKLSAILRVSEAMGIGVIGECVEDQDVLAKLRSLGVPYAQGFGIKRPAPLG